MFHLKCSYSYSLAVNHERPGSNVMLNNGIYYPIIREGNILGNVHGVKPERVASVYLIFVAFY